MGSEDQAVLLQLDAQGDVAIGSYYEGLNAWTGFLGGAAHGTNSVLYTTAQEVVVVDAAGGVVTAVEITDTLADQSSYHFTRGDLRIQNERVVLFGNVVAFDQEGEFIDDYPHVWSFGTEVLDGCMMQRFTPTRMEIPFEDIVILTDTNFLSVDAEAVVVPDAFNTTARTPFTTTDWCSTFLTTAVRDSPAVPVFTVVQVNGGLQVSMEEDAMISVVDARGRLVQGSVLVPAGLTYRLTLQQQQGGLYVVRACARTGVCASQRVVVP